MNGNTEFGALLVAAWGGHSLIRKRCWAARLRVKYAQGKFAFTLRHICAAVLTFSIAGIQIVIETPQAYHRP